MTQLTLFDSILTYFQHKILRLSMVLEILSLRTLEFMAKSTSDYNTNASFWADRTGRDGISPLTFFPFLITWIVLTATTIRTSSFYHQWLGLTGWRSVTLQFILITFFLQYWLPKPHFVRVLNNSRHSEFLCDNSVSKTFRFLTSATGTFLLLSSSAQDGSDLHF